MKFQSHHWPMWGHDKIIDYWKKQRDMYKYIHDQSVNLMNKGYTGVEISNMVKLPPELDKQWYNRGYYGSMKHNTRAVYQRYMGFYDANPTTLDQLPPEEAAKKYVEYMGGAEAILHESQGGFRQGRISAGSRKRSSRWSLPTRTTRTARNCSRTPMSRWAIRPNPARGARSICKARSSFAMACRPPAASTPRAPTPSRRCRPR